MSEIPDDLRYTAEHEWVRDAEESSVRIGITDYAQSALGDVVFVTLPEPGTAVTKGEAVGEIESTKSVSEIFAPLNGNVTARNVRLDDEPGVINSDPYGDGWLFEMTVSEAGEADTLLDAAAYSSLAN